MGWQACINAFEVFEKYCTAVDWVVHPLLQRTSDDYWPLAGDDDDATDDQQRQVERLLLATTHCPYVYRIPVVKSQMILMTSWYAENGKMSTYLRR